MTDDRKLRELAYNYLSVIWPYVGPDGIGWKPPNDHFRQAASDAFAKFYGFTHPTISMKILDEVREVFNMIDPR